MPYISRNGEIAETQPWGISKVVAIFWSILNFFFMFFRTLISPGGHSRGDNYTQDFRGPGGGNTPQHVLGERELEERLRAAGDKLVVIDFYATWCGPCKMIAPHIEQMAASATDVVFLKVDVDESDNVAAKYQVRAMPTIVFIKKSRTLESFSGADIGKLRDTINRLR